jgi:hypothetical protein
LPTSAQPGHGLPLVSLENLGLDRCQPEEIEQSQVTRENLGAEGSQSGEPARAIIPILEFNLVATDVHDQVLTSDRQRGAIDLAEEGVEEAPIDQPLGQSNHQAARTPVREIEMEVEQALHEFGWIAFEVAPFIGVREAGGRDPRSCR